MKNSNLQYHEVKRISQPTKVEIILTVVILALLVPFSSVAMLIGFVSL